MPHLTLNRSCTGDVKFVRGRLAAATDVASAHSAISNLIQSLHMMAAVRARLDASGAMSVARLFEVPEQLLRELADGTTAPAQAIAIASVLVARLDPIAAAIDAAQGN